MLSSVTFVVTDDTAYEYQFSFDWVRATHLYVQINGSDVPSSQYSLSSASVPGSASIILSGDAATNLALNDIIKIEKRTPTSFDDRTVNFSSLTSVTEAELDDAILHCISLAQDAIDDANDALRYDSTYLGYNANFNQIKRLATGTESNDAVTLAQLQAVETVAGNLPSVDAAFNDYVLAVVNGNWGTASPDALKTILLLGDAAYRNVTIGHPGGIMSRQLSDARYFQLTNLLSEIAGSEATVRSNLGLGTAALEAAGSSANEVLKLDSNGDIPAGVGFAGALDLSGQAINQKNGGLYDSISITKVVAGFQLNQDATITSDDTFMSNASNVVGIVEKATNLPTYEFRNSSPSPTDNVVEDSDDSMQLLAGTYEIDAELAVRSRATSGGSPRVAFGLRDATAGSDIDFWNNQDNVVANADEGEHTTGTFKIRAVVTLAGTRKIKLIAATTGAEVFVGWGYIRIHKLST